MIWIRRFSLLIKYRPWKKHSLNKSTKLLGKQCEVCSKNDFYILWQHFLSRHNNSCGYHILLPRDRIQTKLPLVYYAMGQLFLNKGLSWRSPWSLLKCPDNQSQWTWCIEIQTMFETIFCWRQVFWQVQAVWRNNENKILQLKLPPLWSLRQNACWGDLINYTTNTHCATSYHNVQNLLSLSLSLWVPWVIQASWKVSFINSIIWFNREAIVD